MYLVITSETIMNTDFEIRQLPLSLSMVRRRVEQFLSANELRLDDVDYFVGVFRLDDDDILACGGLKGNIIKCIAVDPHLREENLSLTLVSHLISTANSNGFRSVKVFTKPGNRVIFESMGFHLLAEAPKAILMENSLDALDRYKHYLKEEQIKACGASDKDGDQGVIIMNANPFTLGHRYLVEQAARRAAHLNVIVVKEDRSVFPYAERLQMIRKGCAHLSNVTVYEGSDYQISSATFPSYFLKQVSDATDTQILLDLDLFCRHIAPALGVNTRFVGSEPTDLRTRRYNELMHEHLPGRGIQVMEIPRMEATDGIPVSATSVRRCIEEGHATAALAMVPPTTMPYLVAHATTVALQQELDLTPKPGLVDRHDSGAHTDMDYNLMQHSIQALRPYFAELALLACHDTVDVAEMLRIGREGEAAMLQATHGVNTHKGALFALGLSVTAAVHLLHNGTQLSLSALQQGIQSLALMVPAAQDTHGQRAVAGYHVRGALAEAQEGYLKLFTEWLIYLKEHGHEDHALHRLLLLIMSTLDDTNILHRKGPDAAETVKQEARQLFNDFSIQALTDMNGRFIAENISPGGAADMLSLTVFIKTILS